MWGPGGRRWEVPGSGTQETGSVDGGSLQVALGGPNRPLMHGMAGALKGGGDGWRLMSWNFRHARSRRGSPVVLDHREEKVVMEARDECMGSCFGPSFKNRTGE
jgi:hypothetical protein